MDEHDPSALELDSGNPKKPQSAQCAYIYALLNPDTRALAYIGQTTRSIERRFAQHWSSRYDFTGCQYPVRQWMAQLDQEGRKPLIMLLATVPERLAFLYENAYILRYRRRGACLLNVAVPSVEWCAYRCERGW